MMAANAPAKQGGPKYLQGPQEYYPQGHKDKEQIQDTQVFISLTLNPFLP